MAVSIEHKREQRRQQKLRRAARTSEAKQQYRQDIEASEPLKFGFTSMAIFDQWHKESKSGIPWEQSDACRAASKFAADIASGQYD